jgi:hypothetical protein
MTVTVTKTDGTLIVYKEVHEVNAEGSFLRISWVKWETYKSYMGIDTPTKRQDKSIILTSHLIDNVEVIH